MWCVIVFFFLNFFLSSSGEPAGSCWCARACARAMVCPPDIHIDNINLTLAGRELLIDASLCLNWGNRFVTIFCPCRLFFSLFSKKRCAHSRLLACVATCVCVSLGHAERATCALFLSLSASWRAAVVCLLLLLLLLLSGPRYGLLGTNGCGKSLLMGVLGRRLLPIPDNIDTFHVTHEVC